MNEPIRLLMVEDKEGDAALLLFELEKAGLAVDPLRVDTAKALRDALTCRNWDIVTSDHSMPSFDAPAAQAILQELKPQIPLIIVSGEVDPATVECLMRLGARAYIHKDELERLPQAVERVLEESRRARR